MSEEMINLEAYDTLGIKMENPITNKLQELPQPPFFMDPKRALPFWLVRPLQDKMPMVSIPEKIKVPYTRGLVGENLIQSLDPNEFVTVDPTEGRVEYAPLHDKNLKRFFKSSFNRKMVEGTGEIVDGRTACTLKEYNDYRKFIHRMQLNHVIQEQKEEKQIKSKLLDVENFLLAAKKDGKKKWNQKFKDYLKQKNQEDVARKEEIKLKKCAERMEKVEKGAAKVKENLAVAQEMRRNKWLSYKKRMSNYFSNVRDDQRRRGIYARKRWMFEALINEHRKSLAMAESKLKREQVLEMNWNRRVVGQKLKLRKDKLVREQYNACIQLMRQRREKYYDRKDVETDELLALPGMNSLEELEVFNTAFDQFSPEFVDALHGAKIYINRSGKSLTLDKSLRKFISHRESAAERMKKANVARPIKHALDLLIRRSVGYYAMVVTYQTIMDAFPMALHLANKIKSSAKLRELLTEEYEQFGPRSDTPFQTVKNFEEEGMSHCICDYTLINKDTMEWPCPLCRKQKSGSTQSSDSSTMEDSEASIEERPGDLYVIAEGQTTVGFLMPPKRTEGSPEMILEDTKIEIQPMFLDEKEKPKPFVPPPPIPTEGVPEVPASEPEVGVMPPPKEPPKRGSKSSKKSTKSKKSMKSRDSKVSAGSKKSRMSKMSRKSKKSSGSKKTAKGKEGKGKGGKRGDTKKVRGVSKVAGVSDTDTKTQSSISPRGSKKHKPRKSILKVKGHPKQAYSKVNKGVSFAETAEFQKSAKTMSWSKVPPLETATHVQTSVSQQQVAQKPEPFVAKYMPKEFSKDTVATLEPELQEYRSQESIVSLLSITSDDRLHFVKGQCVYDRRGSKLGKLAIPHSSPHSTKKGFLRGTCKCSADPYPWSSSSENANITEMLDNVKEHIEERKRKGMQRRWRGVHKDKPEGSEDEMFTCKKEPAKDLAKIMEKLSRHKKEFKIKYFVNASDLTVRCHCTMCHKEVVQKDNATEGIIEESEGAAKFCRCRMREQQKIGPVKIDRLAYITKVIGGKKKRWSDPKGIEKKSIVSRKLSAKSIVERQKSIISRYFLKKSFKEVTPVKVERREPEVQKYYVDDQGQLYVLNRFGEKTTLKNEGVNFKIDERGRKYFVDSFDEKKYLIDVTGRVYLENENGDVQSLFYEDGKEYLDPEPKKLLLHNMVRESVVDLLQETPQEHLFDNEEELVELVYEYLFEGASSEEKSDEGESKKNEGDSGSDESKGPDETHGERTGAAMNQTLSKDSENLVGPRMPIKRPLNSLICEVPCYREISKLFIQRKKFHDCCAIVFRRCLLYSLAKYTKIMERGFDALDQLDAERKKVTSLDGLVKGLTKITAHYPLKLVKSKRLSPYVDAIVHGFLGTDGYHIFRAGKMSIQGMEVDNASSAPESLRTEAEKKSTKNIENVPGLDLMKQICLCGMEDAATFVDNNLKMPLTDLINAAVCKKEE
ncbi:hypothetical protein GE061_006981 [Apolygus lucorum]|uniref:Uncharacterized protein n=1 Tax=Apolygus lucorum TaxID=248454 RepID=A0A8S9WS76_APOLU|nr:hypothetical protein GE061_006981 [Apolygus lucorum]